jgi:hypothetical protein
MINATSRDIRPSPTGHRLLFENFIKWDNCHMFCPETFRKGNEIYFLFVK